MIKPLINKPFGFSEFFNSKIGVGDASVCVNMYYHAHGGLLPVSCLVNFGPRPQRLFFGFGVSLVRWELSSFMPW